MPKKDEEPPSRDELVEKIANALRKQATKPNMHAYTPHKKQLMFHQSPKQVRLYIGGNRSGKSVGGVIEDLWWVTGRHPYRKIPDKEIFGRVLGVDFINGVQGILIPIFKRWIVPSDLVGGSWEVSWSNSERLLTLANGNQIDFKSYDQDLDKMAGTSRDFIHFDEEPPRSVFDENLTRLVDVQGCAWITMTPVQGLTWTYTSLYEPYKAGKRPDLDVIEVDMSENPFLGTRESLLAFMEKDTREKREHGKFVPRGGLVYHDFDNRVHYKLSGLWRPPPDWLVYHSLDHGFNNPTASLHHAVSPDGNSVVTFGEHYKRETIVADHAKEILKWEQDNHIDVFLRTGDPAMKQRNGQTGTSIQQSYADEGLIFALDSVPRNVQIGVDRINTYLKINPATKEPWWQATKACPNLFREMRQLHWDYYTSPKLEDSNNVRETIHKKDDHAPDALRYFFTFLPDLINEGLDSIGDTEQRVATGGIDSIWDFMERFTTDKSLVGSSVAPQHWKVREGFDRMADVEYE